ncbi:hypothetical protein TB1_035869 [Malus domestica]|uniref:Uncharacterized protein n=1 Tax=Malus domestica TaxID=3750 RepID=A0A498JZ66_MALDO|nr:hypothetical protein DVH24_011339 [Malus domestica]
MNNVIHHPVTICTVFPRRVNSIGIWNASQTSRVSVNASLLHFSFPLQNYTLPVLEFEMTLIYIVTQLTHLFLNMFGLPVLAAQLVAGILLGDAGLDRVIQHFRPEQENPIFPFTNQEVLNVISLFGFTLFSFLIGVKIDLGLVSKIGKKAIYNGVLTLVVPLIAGFLTLLFLTWEWSLNADEVVQLIFVTAMHIQAPSTVIACLLTELKILNTELGRLALSSALVCDFFSIALTTVATLVKVLQNDAWRGMRDIGVMIIYTLSVFCVFRPIMFWIVKRTPEGSPVKDSYIFFILLAFLGSGLFSHWCELPIVIGPLILGFAVPDGPPLGATLVKKLDFMVNRVFMPVFVTTSLMRVTVSLEMPPAHRRVVLGTAIVTFVIFLSKFAASMVTPLCCKMPLRHAVALALIMTSKGVVEIAAYTIAKDTWVIVSGVFNHMMFTVLLSAIVVPPLVKYLYDPKKKYAGYHRKALLNSKPNSELRILACINRADNTPAIINLIDASCPTRESPIGLYVLHLIELVARTTSVLISHNLQTRALSNYSYSDNIIRSFVQFMKENEEAVFVHVFTAISPSLYMYDDVCTLALDKNTSLIILPFHRKWSVTNGSIESENQAARTLNCRVLETAPCSVGILVNRGHVKCTNSSVSPAETYRVALVFIGGSDDWEALMFAKRMLRDACISLTVIRLVYASEDKESFTKWEVVQDNEMLKEVRHNGTGYVSYVEEHVADSTQTTRKIRSLMDEDEYDLYIVGRRYNMRSPQTLGLEQWSEFPELGVIGDMLASADYCCKFSVLVIQHQQQGTSS